MKTVGIIDVGTNSVLALGLNAQKRVLFNDYQISELGKGLVNNNNYLYPENIERTFSIISEFVGKLKACEIHNIFVIGTSASRDAKNIALLAEKIDSAFGLKYHILTGDEEAEYTYLGALSTFSEIDKPYLMMDIGGGSSELIYGSGTSILFKESFQVGAVRLFDQLNNAYCFTDKEIERTKLHIQKGFHHLPSILKETNFVGIGGTFTTAVSIHLSLNDYLPEKVNGQYLSRVELANIFETINRKNSSERIKLIGLEPKRAPYILYGMLIYMVVMEVLHLERVAVSDNGLRFGYALKKLTF